MKLDLVATGYIFYNNKVLLVYHNKLNKWLPVGGHIEKNETPDDALRREVKEETNLLIKILGRPSLSEEGNIGQNLATPFYVNIHSVGNHNHCSFFYACEALNPNELKINKEIKKFRWFAKNELDEKIISIDVKNQALKALKIINK